MINDKIIQKYIDKLKFISNDCIQRGKYETSMVSLSAAADIMYTYNQYYSDIYIEDQILKIRDIILDGPNSYDAKKNVVLFYDGFGLDLRGWAVSYVKALTQLGYFLVYLCPAHSEIPHIIGEMNPDNSVLIYLDGSNNEKTKLIDEYFGEYKPGTAFFYTYPNDISAAVAFANNPLTTRIQIDLTDHAFWVGVTALDYIIECREMGASLAIFERNIKSEQILKLDCSPYVVLDKCQEDYPFDIYNEKYFFTGGALYKTLGDKEMLYYKTVSYILDNYDNIKFLYAGTGDDTEIKKLEVKYSNRVFHINERGDFFEIIKHSVLYLNSYPMFGGLMMRYAALAQKVPITLKHDNDAEGILINQADLGIEFDDYGEYLKEIDKLLSDDIYRKKQEDKLQGATIDEESFSRNIKMIIEEHKTEYSFINIPRIDTTRFRLEYLERNDMHSMYKTIARKNNYLLLVYFPKEFFFGVLLKIKGKLINDKL